MLNQDESPVIKLCSLYPVNQGEWMAVCQTDNGLISISKGTQVITTGKGTLEVGIQGTISQIVPDHIFFENSLQGLSIQCITYPFPGAEIRLQNNSTLWAKITELDLAIKS